MNKKVKFLLVLLPGLLAFMLFTSGQVFSASGSSYVGTDACLGCHDEMGANLSSSLHGKAWLAAGKYRESGCEACHGPGSTHAENPSKESIVSFGKNAVQNAKDQSTQCLSCHASSQEVALWDMGKHAKRDVACSDCHSIHEGYSPLAKMPETCYSCHLDVKIDANQQSRHPIKEGKISCNDCHNPHGTLSTAQIRDESINQLCYQCHADKRGPFMWEHPPVEENCATCHTPHGSRHKKMLVQKVPNLCQSCHDWRFHPGTPYDEAASFAGSSPSNRFFGRSCQNCHVNIHGSWAPDNVGGSGHANGKAFLR